MGEKKLGDHGQERLVHIAIDMEKFDAAAGGRWPGGPGVPVAVDSDQESCRSAAGEEDPLVSRMWKKLEKLPVVDTVAGSPEDAPCIWRTPPSIRQQESEAYEPKIVSIGPFHHGKESLLAMEEVKLVYLRDLLERSPTNELDSYIRAIRLCVRRARRQYAEVVDLADDEFVEMLVIDGCFIIEYFVKRVFKQTSATTSLSSVRWGFSHLRRDLMLLENQIPFFVLVKLFENSKIPFRGTRKDPLTLVEISLRFLDIKLPVDEQPSSDRVLHLLHLYHLCLDPSLVMEDRSYSFSQIVLYPFKKAADLGSLLFFGLLYLVFIRRLPLCFSPTKKSNAAPRMIPCATELAEAGVHFRKKDLEEGKGKCFLKVSFTDGTLEVPFLKVEESTSPKLRNLIALEQCCPHVGSYFTSFGILMDNFINTAEDVAILRNCGIIESKLGSDQEVADMFNALCKGTHIKYEDHYNVNLFKAVKGHCEFAHHRWRATLVHKYFNNPWTVISLLAGCLLLFLTATQTYFTVFPRKGGG